MATNTTINGSKYYRITRRVGVKLDNTGAIVPEYRQFYGKTKSEALAKYAAYMETLEAPAAARQPFRVCFDTWLNEIFNNCQLAPSTKDLYRRAYNKYMHNAKITLLPVNQITPLQLQTFINQLQAPYNSKRALYKILRRFYKYMSVNYQLQDITAGIEIDKPKTADLSAVNGVTVWNIDELKKVLAGLKNHRLQLLVILAVNTGARISELLALKYTDITDNQLHITRQTYEPDNLPVTIRKPKTASSCRIIPLHRHRVKSRLNRKLELQ